MFEILYTVKRIDGDYAVLVPEGGGPEDENPVALALLPPETDEGVRLLCRDFAYSLWEGTETGRDN